MPILWLSLLSPVLGAMLCLIFWKRPRVHQWVFGGAIGLHLVCSVLLVKQVWEHGIVVAQSGMWPAPYGISMVADLLSSVMVVLGSLSALCIFLYSIPALDKQRQTFGFYPLLLLLLFGISGAFLAGDIFNLYVWFEIILLSAISMVTLGGTRAQLEGGVKYLAINVVASAFLLTGIGLVYGITGALNMAEISLRLRDIPQPGMATLASIFFLMGFGIKAALFPLFFWLPASYHTAPITITAMLAGLLSKVGVYALVRFFTLMFPVHEGIMPTVLLFMAGAGMVAGALGAIAQNDVRKIFSFSIVSQIGYMVMGLAIATPLALAGLVYFLIHSILVKTNLFLISGVLREANRTYHLQKLGNAYDKYPLLAVAFVISGFSLVGVPPLSGFWGKFMLAKGGFEAGQWLITGIALGSGILTLFYTSRVWKEAFWKRLPDKEPPPDPYINQWDLYRKRALMVMPVALLTVIIVVISVYAEPLIAFSVRAGLQLHHPQEYIRTVLHPPMP